MQAGEESALRSRIAEMLGAGLKTQIEPFPENDREFAQILADLQQLERSDLRGKLVLAGFADKPIGPDNMRCLECMYYLVHRRWCDLPELAVPVEPNWWCRLWRI
jgi:hypothetical protein